MDDGFFILHRSLGWRYGLHLMAGVFVGPFFFGTFYRSATLYHPQRRAIIHLKTQQKKQILERNPISKATKLQDLKAYKDKSLHFALISSFLTSFGIYAPFINMVSWWWAFFLKKSTMHLIFISLSRFRMHLTQKS